MAKYKLNMIIELKQLHYREEIPRIGKVLLGRIKNEQPNPQRSRNYQYDICWIMERWNKTGYGFKVLNLDLPYPDLFRTIFSLQ